MAETLQFQCRDCGNIVERPRNPRACPSCGGTVMKPAELSEPGSSTNEIQTEDFDLTEELSRLDQITDEDPSDNDSSKTSPNSSADPETHDSSSSRSTTSQSSGTLKSLVETVKGLIQS